MPQVPVWVKGFLLVLTVVGLGLIVIAGQELYRYQWRLPRERLTTTATVDDWRINTSGRYSGKRYEVRYHFSPPGSTATYRAEEKVLFFERTNLWIPIDEETWEASQESGEIEVEYSTEEPTLNQPVAGRTSTGDSLAGLGIGVFLVALGGLVLAPGILRRPRTTPTPPEPL